LLDEIEAAVRIRDDEGEIRLFDYAENAFGTVVAQGFVLANGHPAIVVDHGRIGGDQLGAGRRRVGIFCQHAMTLTDRCSRSGVVVWLGLGATDS
jgi:hypothetical protein